jgi:hypothetical protein
MESARDGKKGVLGSVDERAAVPAKSHAASLLDWK